MQGIKYRIETFIQTYCEYKRGAGMAESIILKNLSLSASSQPGITILGEPITNFIPVR